MINLKHNREEHRYEAWTEGKLAGLALYRIDGDVVALTHTEVDPSFAGRGIGGDIVGFALDDVRAAGLKVAPICPFVARWIERHHNYVDLLA